MQKTAQTAKLHPLVDVVFRRLFEEQALLMALLNGVLGLSGPERLVELTVIRSHVLGPLADDKEVVVDLRAQTLNRRQFHIEVQLRNFAAYPERMLYYWAGMYQGQLVAGKSYVDLQPVVSVHFLGFCLSSQGEQAGYHQVFELRERRSHQRLSGHAQLHTIEVPRFTQALDEISTDEERWLYWLTRAQEMTPAQVQALGLVQIQQAEERLIMISQDRILQIQHEQLRHAQLDAYARRREHELAKAELDKAKAEQERALEQAKAEQERALEQAKAEQERALEQAKAQLQKEGLKQGKQEGLKQGKAEGKQEGRVEGLQQAILLALSSRGLRVSARAKSRILACRDMSALQELMTRAVQVTAAKDLFST